MNACVNPGDIARSKSKSELSPMSGFRLAATDGQINLQAYIGLYIQTVVTMVISVLADNYGVDFTWVLYFSLKTDKLKVKISMIKPYKT